MNGIDSTESLIFLPIFPAKSNAPSISRVFSDKILFTLSKRINYHFKQFQKAKKIVDNIKPECVIFQSMSPMNINTGIFPSISKPSSFVIAVQHGPEPFVSIQLAQSFVLRENLSYPFEG